MVFYQNGNELAQLLRRGQSAPAQAGTFALRVALIGACFSLNHFLKMNWISWLLRLIVAGILLQTLYFKFSAAPESVWIFTQLGIEPWGRVASGVAELVAAILLLLPRSAGLGAGLALGIISGAILSHLAVLGIEILGDGGLLFGLAVAVFLGSAAVAWLHRMEIPFVQKLFSGRG